MIIDGTIIIATLFLDGEKILPVDGRIKEIVNEDKRSDYFISASGDIYTTINSNIPLLIQSISDLIKSRDLKTREDTSKLFDEIAVGYFDFEDLM